jgi:hypothetical protein
MKTLLYSSGILLSLLFSSCKEIVQDTSERSKVPPASSDKIEWMRLNDEWVPVITEFDKLLYSGLKAYIRKDYKEASQKISEANAILVKKNEKDHPGKDELKRSSESLRKLSERIKDSTVSGLEVDTVLYKVCDVSGKNCWIMQDREDDYWVSEEELSKHIDSSYAKVSANDTTAITNLDKANALIKIKKRQIKNQKIQKYLMKAEDELQTIINKVKKREKIVVSKLAEPIAKSYFSLAISYYIYASIEFNGKRDNKRMGNEIESSATCLRKAFKYGGVELSEEEAFILERAQFLGVDLKGGFSHEVDDIEDVLRLLSRMIRERRIIFYPQGTDDDYAIS